MDYHAAAEEIYQTLVAGNWLRFPTGHAHELIPIIVGVLASSGNQKKKKKKRTPAPAG
jgi:hypothetical protein